MNPLNASTVLFSSWCVFLGKNVDATSRVTGLQKRISKFKISNVAKNSRRPFYATWFKTVISVKIVCAKHAENLMPSPQQKLKTSAEVSDNEHEEENSKIILVVIKKILIINVRHKIYLSQMLSN